MKNLIYPAPDIQVGAPPPSFVEVVLPLADGSEFIAWHRPQTGEDSRPAMVFFHGNGENLETMKWAGLYEQLSSLAVPVLAVDYPGYGRGTGRSSEESLKEASEVAFQWMGQQYPGRGVVPCGWSLGAALAIHLAATSPAELVGVVAISPWTSLTEVANGHFPRWLVSVGLREEYDSLTAARSIASPALILHGTVDQIIPAEQGQRLAAELKTARWVPVAGAGHNDLLSFPVVWREIDSFVSGLKTPGSV